MVREALKAYLETAFPACKFEDSVDFPVMVVDKEQLFSVARQLKEDPATRFDYLFCQTAADYSERMEVIYHLTSTTFRHDLEVKVVLEDREHPEVDSVCPLWMASELYENEIFDLFGIRFINHPNLRRIMLGDEWPGHPLRKDYTDATVLIP